MVLGKVVKLVKNQYGKIQVMEGEHVGKQIYVSQTSDSNALVKKHQIVRFDIDINDKNKFEAINVQLFKFKKFDTLESVVLPSMSNILGVVKSYDATKGWGFIELQTADGPIVQYVNYRNIVTKRPCYKKLERYELVLTDVENESEKSQCKNIRSAYSKFKCELQSKKKSE